MRGVKKYDDEFKQSAVKKVFDGQSVASVARDLGISEGLLHKWKKRKIESGSDLERENLELKKRLREVVRWSNYSAQKTLCKMRV
jgi:Transposase and inactivated derivatives